MHEGRLNTFLHDVCSDRTLHPGVTESHILPLEGLFSAILTPDSWRKKGQMFPPVLHLLETLIKHSERKNRKGKKKPQPFLFLLLLSGRIKEEFGASRSFKYSGAVLSYSEQSSQITDMTHSCPGECRSTKTVQSRRPETEQRPKLLSAEALTHN